ncbi:low affinity immunoglobulin epsilon Fc receptor isoform X1 [Drosophila ficusphila]|uniref:low affinity immunoglobulin epsilon Fc receptor isoform X1 n=1 Tax=Drosophila ficusphila TaxID=30025 RepID=UPI0007E7E740|nr:low affinity immunoglobulin epsilon Fc receptor isoform X1 [Drosophila ficusphila]
MLRPTLIVVLISLASVDSGHNTPPNKIPVTVHVSNVPHGFHLNKNNHIASTSTSSNISHNPEENGRNKRGTQLDQSEIARQNQITQQIFANYLERRLFPNRTANQKIPTIADILPKPKPSPRPRPRGFAASDGRNFKRSGGGAQRNRLAAAASKRQSGYNRKRLQEVEEEEEDEQDQDQDRDQQQQANQEDFDYDVQESLQSVESEQHDQYYGNIFHRDPSENEVDADCPNCVDESQYTPNKWTMPLLKLGEKRYYLGIFFKANWFKATQYCRYHGMHLASISSQEENDRLEKHIRDFGLGHEHFWISGTDLADEGNFFWMATGRPITFTNWNAGEPNNFRYENGEEENCLELWNRDGKGLKWNDSPCSFETYFVCEVQPN